MGQDVVWGTFRKSNERNAYPHTIVPPLSSVEVEMNEGHGRVLSRSDVETGKVEGYPHPLASKRG